MTVSRVPASSCDFELALKLPPYSYRVAPALLQKFLGIPFRRSITRYINFAEFCYIFFIMVNASELVGATPSGAYSWRPPSPPHIHVPQAPDDQKFILPAYNGISGTAAEQEILRIVTRGDDAFVVPKSWVYEFRRKAQPILSFLHLGPSAAARDIEYLKAEGITMLLVIRDTRSAHARLLSGEKVAQQMGIEAASIDVANQQQLIAAFPRAIQTINDHLVSEYRKYVSRVSDIEHSTRTSWGKVLVFCESGNERSACVVAAYLMNTYGMDLVSAVQHVQAQRFCVAFDDSIKTLLLSYQTILDATKVVAGVSTAISNHHLTSSILSGPRPKRSRDEVDMSEQGMDLDEADDEARFVDRRPFVPFHDEAARNMA